MDKLVSWPQSVSAHHSTLMYFYLFVIIIAFSQTIAILI